MAGRWGGGQVTVTTTAQTLTALLGLTDRAFPKELSIKKDSASSNVVYLGPSTVTNVPANARIVLDSSNGSYRFGAGDLAILNTSDVYLCSTTGTTICFVSILE